MSTTIHQLLNHLKIQSVAKGSIILALGISSSLVTPAKADPPPTPGLSVFCFRFTDVKQINGAGSNDFQFEFEVLNWTSANATALLVTFVKPGVTLSNGNLLTKGVNISNAFIDPDGRLLPPGPATPIPGNVGNAPVGSGLTSNDWTAGLSDQETTKEAIYQQVTTPLPNINLVKIQNENPTPEGTIDAINNLPAPPADEYGNGYFPNGDFSPIANLETIDNGTNVLDGFAFEAIDFKEGDYLSFGWQLLPDVTSPAGNGSVILSRGAPARLSFPTVNGFGTTTTSSNFTLFAPNSPSPVGSQFGFKGAIAANVPIGSITEAVPGPLPILGLAVAFRFSRKLRNRISNQKKAYAMG